MFYNINIHFLPVLTCHSKPSHEGWLCGLSECVDAVPLAARREEEYKATRIAPM